ncbi:uncharacterized protein EI97DRAFT_13229 [Westerdykella ornata]|uniref:Uncharacterized protein n=1 Tax=Westerdykella ornata TaxID=318751 RepID=A0A6A6JWX0_WESOR|nr:uncharacterized protein EI97DRAFT_13229 [Westerdykella ornata]KAF2280907.1 hypothetical protein EI97DRAFT_13229 [Westerdykella ornata]
MPTKTEKERQKEDENPTPRSTPTLIISHLSSVQHASLPLSTGGLGEWSCHQCRTPWHPSNRTTKTRRWKRRKGRNKTLKTGSQWYLNFSHSRSTKPPSSACPAQEKQGPQLRARNAPERNQCSDIQLAEVIYSENSTESNQPQKCEEDGKEKRR